MYFLFAGTGVGGVEAVAGAAAGVLGAVLEGTVVVSGIAVQALFEAEVLLMNDLP